MHEFYLYAGQAGRDTLKRLIKCYLNNSWNEKTLDECNRLFAVDKDIANRDAILPVRFEEKYLHQLTPNQRALKRGKNINRLVGVFQFESDMPGFGVGKKMPIGQAVAQSAFPAMYDRIKAEIISSDHIHISHSGGGGIGCGSGPVFSEEFQKLQKNDRSKRFAVTASVFLPRLMGEPVQAIPNTCSTIGLHSKWCDGIFLYDVNNTENWEKSNGPIAPEKSAGHFWLVDYALAEVQLTLASLNERVYEKAGKNIEGSDLISFCRGPVGGPCGIIVPCYAEYEVKLLKDLSVRVLIKDLLTNRSLISYSQDKAIERVGLFVIYPSSLTKNVQNMIEEQADVCLTELMPNIKDKNEEDNWAFCYSNSSGTDRIKMLALLVNPCVNSMVTMHISCLKKLVSWGNFLKENIHDVRTYEETKKTIKKLKDYCKEELSNWENPIVSKTDYENIIADLETDRKKKTIIEEWKNNKSDMEPKDFEKYIDGFILYGDHLFDIRKRMKF